MGTHPIFESDFDCLTEKMDEPKLSKSEKQSEQRKQKLLALNPKDQKKYAKKVKQIRKKGQTAKKESGVLYVGHLPTQIAEPDLRKYFEQFGKVLRLRLSRSKKSGRSKGYGFIEFEDAKEGKIAAKTMDKYLFHERLLQCKMMNKEQLAEDFWKGSNQRFQVGLVYRKARTEHNRKTNAKNAGQKLREREKKDAALMEALKEAGVTNYVPPETVGKAEVATVPETSPKKTKKRTFAEAVPNDEAETPANKK